MLTVGDTFPAFEVKVQQGAEPPADDFERITEKSYPGKWKVFFFWPKDFTFVCPTEIIAFGALKDQFEARDAVIIGGSTDSDFVHLAWRQSNPDLAAADYPWIADTSKALAGALGILEKSEGVCYRATFIVDPDNVIRYAAVNDLDVGRNPQEVLRVLDALQTGSLCPASWQPGQKTLSAA